jgi:hypothetical protein
MNSFISKSNLYCHTLDKINPIGPDLKCEVRLLDEIDVNILHCVWPVNLDEMRMRLRRGDVCFTCFSEGQLAHYSWVQFSGLHELHEAGLKINIPLGQAWIYHCRTADWAWGKNIYPFVLVQILDLCRSRSCDTAWIYTTPKNIASQRGIQKAGFLLYKQLTAFKIFNKHFPVVRLPENRFG